jgi:large subunit ribosomal protein L5
MRTNNIIMSLSEHYQQQVIPKMLSEMGVTNINRVPRVTKIVINVGLGEAMSDKKVLEVMGSQLSLITGQKPLTTRARRAIATFKLRAGMPIGLKVTLRNKKMWAFLQKLIAIVLPRVRDFRGVAIANIDRDGNLNLGFTEISVFPEVQYETLDKIRGLQVTIVTNAHKREEGHKLLEYIGIPFEKVKN